MLVGHYRSAFAYRNFIISAIRGDFKNRFAGSKIGALWNLLHPLAMAGIYAFVLSRVLGAKIGGVDNPASYGIFLISGLAVWGLYNDIVMRSLTIFIEYGGTLKKIALPRISLPLIVLGSAMISHGLLLLAGFAIFALFNHFPSPVWLLLPLGAIVAIILAFGIGILLGTLNVFARDIGQVMTIIMQFWFWMTPIVYQKDMLSGAASRVIELNPMTPVVVYYQDILLYKRMPDFQSLAYPGLLGIVILLLALFIFRRASAEIVDVL